MTATCTPAPRALEHLGPLHRACIVATEAAWGREGVWCPACRRSTPVEQLAVLPLAVVVRCESCDRELLSLSSPASDGFALTSV